MTRRKKGNVVAFPAVRPPDYSPKVVHTYMTRLTLETADPMEVEHIARQLRELFGERRHRQPVIIKVEKLHYEGDRVRECWPLDWEEK